MSDTQRTAGRPRTLPRCGSIDPDDADHVCDLAEGHRGAHVAGEDDWERESRSRGISPRDCQIGPIRVSREEQERWVRCAEERRVTVSDLIRGLLERVETDLGL